MSDTFEYVPKACKDDGETKAKFSGSVTLKAMDFDQACEAQEQLNTATKDVPAENHTVRWTREAVKVVVPYVVAVGLKRLSDGKEFDSWGALLKGRCSTVLTDVASTCLVGEGNG